MEQIFTIKNIVIYLLAINLISFLAMLIDKKKAQKGSYRISEKTLMVLALIGGSIGGLCGMYLFRHKTKHFRFTFGIPFILILEVSAVMYFLFK